MEIVAWIVKKQSYACVCISATKVSYAVVAYHIVTLNKGGRKGGRTQGAFMTLLMHVHLSR